MADVASHLQVGRDSIYRWVDSKGFPAHRVGRLLRFRLSEADEWVKTDGGSVPQTSELNPETLARGARGPIKSS